jgi:hypothetical protein
LSLRLIPAVAKKMSRPWMAFAVLAMWVAGCGKDTAAIKPLIDARHRPVVLVESGALAPSVAGGTGAGCDRRGEGGGPVSASESESEPESANRFGSGWAARQIAGEHVLVPAAQVVRLEVVNLGEGRPRTLTLSGVEMAPVRGRTLRLRTTDRELARVALKLPLALRLPEDLPLGCVELELGLDLEPGRGKPGDEGRLGSAPTSAARPAVAGGGNEASGGIGAGWGIGITSARVAPSLPAGKARIEAGDVLEAGNVLVEVTHELAGGEVLVGSFVPPARARPGQRFELTAERPDGTPIRRFFWSPSFWDRFRGARVIELPLRDARDFVRVRLVSRGASGDPPARWRGLGLAPANGRELPPGL